jgi:membrane protein
MQVTAADVRNMAPSREVTTDMAAGLLSPIVLVRNTFAGWSRGQAGLNAAALAFFTLLSLAPLLMLTVAVAGQVVSKPGIERAIVNMANQRAGYPAAVVVHDSLSRRRRLPTSNGAAALSIAMLVFGASTVVLRLRASTNAMWDLVPARKGLRSHAAAVVHERFLSALLTLMLGLVLLALLAVNALIAIAYRRYLHAFIPPSVLASSTARDVLTLVGFVAVFAASFKLLPQASARLRDLLPGAVATALLFWSGTRVLGKYLEGVAAESAYDAVGSVIVFLLWVYYSAMIYLLGARFAAVWATLYGAGIKPGRYMALATAVEQIAE